MSNKSFARKENEFIKSGVAIALNRKDSAVQMQAYLETTTVFAIQTGRARVINAFVSTIADAKLPKADIFFIRSWIAEVSDETGAKIFKELSDGNYQVVVDIREDAETNQELQLAIRNCSWIDLKKAEALRRKTERLKAEAEAKEKAEAEAKEKAEAEAKEEAEAKAEAKEEAEADTAISVWKILDQATDISQQAKDEIYAILARESESFASIYKSKAA